MDKEITDLIIFYCIYLLGVIIYFSHFSILACKGISKLCALRHLSEDEELEVFERYFPKVLFQTVIMGEFPVLFSVYIMVNENFSDNIFISSGLFTVVWLLIAGIIIKRSYRLVIYKIKEKLGYDFDRSFCNKEVFWVMCTLLYGILFGLYDWKIFLIILSIVLVLINTSNNEGIYKILRAFNVVYSMGNLKDFYMADIEGIKRIIEGVNDDDIVKQGGITRKIALSKFVELLKKDLILLGVEVDELAMPQVPDSVSN